MNMAANINYNAWFVPPPAAASDPQEYAGRDGDRSAKAVYIYNDDAIRAINVAGVTRRPLLIGGPSGCGKSSLAAHVAQIMEWEYLPFTITSRTQAGDLLYRVDHLKRLQDAQAGNNVDVMANYVEPGVLWRAFDKEGADAKTKGAPRPPNYDPLAPPVQGRSNGTVVLLDEIDKADPDVPNNLLLPLGSYTFDVEELKIRVHAQRVPLVILTTNNERRLPDAFLRRCVNLVVTKPNRDWLIQVGRAHFPQAAEERITKIADLLLKGPVVPSTAEFLDTVQASLTLKIDPEFASAEWKWLTEITAWKSKRAGDA
jgi:MoxR-like ATPase